MFIPFIMAVTVTKLTEAAVASVNSGYVAALERRDVTAATAPYADDVVFVASGNRVIRGKAALAAMLRTRLSSATFLGGSCVTDTLRATDRQAWETGHCAFTVRTAAGTVSTRGHYMAYWKRQANNEWLIETNVAE